MSYALFLIRQLTRSVWKKSSRAVLRLLMRNAPAEKRVAAERRMRGREDCRKLKLADFVVVSFGKSGRTWLRMMISRVFQLRHGVGERYLIGFDNLHHKNRAIPKILFTHDNYIKDFTGNHDNKADYYDKRVILLVRDPRDVAVSQYFQWKHRMKPVKKELNDYPPHGADVSTFEFLTRYDAGLPKVTGFMNVWAKEAEKIRALLVVRYEDFKSNPAQTLKQVMEFLDTPASDAEIAQAVEFASLDNMRKMEQGNVFWLSGGRMKPRDRDDPNSYKVRRGKAGGYRDDFDDSELAEVDAYVTNNLAPLYGYGETGQPVAPTIASAQSGASSGG